MPSAAFYTDQHGRRFKSSVVMVHKVYDPPGAVLYDRTGYLVPVGWSSPYQFWNFAPDFISAVANTDYDNALHFDYESFILDRKEKHAAWEAGVNNAMRAQFKTAWEPGLTPTVEALKVAGPRPQAWQPADAARRGNRWVLFGEGECPKALAEFFVAPVAAPTIDLGEPGVDIYADEQVAPDIEQVEDEEDRRRAKDAERKRRERASKSLSGQMAGVTDDGEG